MSWLLAFVGFALLVILHEFGHFLAAKRVGMRVERFSLFFPPLIARKQVGETEYAIGAVPLGGYVKITGMNPDEELDEEAKARSYSAAPVWKRIVVIAAGPAMNLLVAFILLLVFFWLIGPQEGTDKVQAVEKGFPAAAVLQPGDRVLSVDGVSGGPTELNEQVGKHRCEGTPKDGCKGASAASVLVERDGRERTIELTPVYDTGVDPARMRLGFAYDPNGPRRPFGFGEALDVSLEQFWFITKQMLTLPARLFDTEKRKEISGVVGSYEVTRQTILSDLAEVVGILAIISLSLAIVNLFPFLPLDGGHIFWALVEKIRRKPVSYRTMEQASVVGFMLVIGLFAIGLTNDIGRLSGEGFNVR